MPYKFSYTFKDILTYFRRHSSGPFFPSAHLMNRHCYNLIFLGRSGTPGVEGAPGLSGPAGQVGPLGKRGPDGQGNIAGEPGEPGKSECFILHKI